MLWLIHEADLSDLLVLPRQKNTWVGIGLNQSFIITALLHYQKQVLIDQLIWSNRADSLRTLNDQHLIAQAQTTEPTIGQVKSDLFA